jgi:hypothetical protein
MPFPNCCVACGQRHIRCEEEEVKVYDRDGIALVTYNKGCEELAKAMTEEGLLERGYVTKGVAGRIVEGIKEGFGPKKTVEDLTVEDVIEVSRMKKKGRW